MRILKILKRISIFLFIALFLRGIGFAWGNIIIMVLCVAGIIFIDDDGYFR